MTDNEVINKDGVFRPLKKINLEDETKGKVIFKKSDIVDFSRKYRVKVNSDVLQGFLEERKWL